MNKRDAEQSSKSPTAHSRPEPEEIARRAHQLWEERGKPHGSPDDDWYRAEHELRHQSDQRAGEADPEEDRPEAKERTSQ